MVGESLGGGWRVERGLSLVMSSQKKVSKERETDRENWVFKTGAGIFFRERFQSVSGPL